MTEIELYERLVFHYDKYFYQFKKSQSEQAILEMQNAIKMLKMNQTIKENRAVAWSLYNFAMSISFMLADFLARLIADRFGLLMVYRVCGLSATFYLIYYYWKSVSNPRTLTSHKHPMKPLIS